MAFEGPVSLIDDAEDRYFGASDPWNGARYRRPDPLFRASLPDAPPLPPIFPGTPPARPAGTASIYDVLALLRTLTGTPPQSGLGGWDLQRAARTPPFFPPWMSTPGVGDATADMPATSDPSTAGAAPSGSPATDTPSPAALGAAVSADPSTQVATARGFPLLTAGSNPLLATAAGGGAGVPGSTTIDPLAPPMDPLRMLGQPASKPVADTRLVAERRRSRSGRQRDHRWRGHARRQARSLLAENLAS